MSRDTMATGANRKYIKHPPAADALSTVANGQPMDAGTWTLVVNNVHVLQAESARELFTDVGAAVAKPSDGGWESLDEWAPAAADRSGVGVIAWNTMGSTPTARRFGPFPIVNDRQIASPTAEDGIGRKISVHVRYYSDGVTTFTVYAAITSSSSSPARGNVMASDLTTMTTTSASDQDSTVTLDFRTGSLVPHPTGVASATGAGEVQVAQYYVWVGWVITGGTAGIRNMDGWEYGPAD